MEVIIRSRPLIFTNLPFELEDYIISIYRAEKARQAQNLRSFYTSDELVAELYRRSMLMPSETMTSPASVPSTLVHSTDSSIPPLPLGYVRDFYRVYKMTVEDVQTTGLSFNALSIHSVINLTTMLNNAIGDRLISIESLGYYDTVMWLNETMIDSHGGVTDIYDRALAAYWRKCPLARKLAIVKKIFGRIKLDYFSEYGAVGVHDRVSKFKISAYRILRFLYINDREGKTFILEQQPLRPIGDTA